MDKKTALSAAGALAMTATAAVSALFLTIGQGATAAPATGPTEVSTDYQVITVDELGVPLSVPTETVSSPSASAPSYEEPEDDTAEYDTAEYGEAEYEDEHEHNEHENNEHEHEDEEDDDD